MSIPEYADKKLLPGFKRSFIKVNGNSILTLTAGEGPPLLLLHGDPQTHLCWHHLAPKLTDRFTVVLTDLRGRGESHKPAHNPHRNAYTKREMADEQLAVMRALGHESFSLMGHDRGARVARRLTLDHPDAVCQLVVMDIIPELDFYSNFTAEIAQEYFYFSFLTQDYPIPERLILGDAEGFMKFILTGSFGLTDRYAEAALKAYLSVNTTPESITAMCECFRAGYHLDRNHDMADRENANIITCPTLIMWGEHGVLGRHFDVQNIWRSWCSSPQFLPISSGHFIAEEAPYEALSGLNEFLTDPRL